MKTCCPYRGRSLLRSWDTVKQQLTPRSRYGIVLSYRLLGIESYLSPLRLESLAISIPG